MIPWASSRRRAGRDGELFWQTFITVAEIVWNIAPVQSAFISREIRAISKKEEKRKIRGNRREEEEEKPVENGKRRRREGEREEEFDADSVINYERHYQRVRFFSRGHFHPASGHRFCPVCRS